MLHDWLAYLTKDTVIPRYSKDCSISLKKQNQYRIYPKYSDILTPCYG